MRAAPSSSTRSAIARGAWLVLPCHIGFMDASFMQKTWSTRVLMLENTMRHHAAAIQTVTSRRWGRVDARSDRLF